jgi:hypothetical protein
LKQIIKFGLKRVVRRGNKENKLVVVSLKNFKKQDTTPRHETGITRVYRVVRFFGGKPMRRGKEG